MDSYLNQMCSALPRHQCAEPTIPCTFPYTENPKSVHFVVNELGFSQLANLTDTTFGIDYIDGTYPLGPLLPITDVNGPFIHIALSGNPDATLITLLCCIGIEVGQSLSIITAGDLQTTRPSFPLSPTLQTQVDDCVASGGFVNPPNIFDLLDRIEDLELCCINNTSDIANLQEDVELANGRITILEGKVTGLQGQVVALQELTSVIPVLQAAIITLQSQVADILARCCPEQSATVCFDYRIATAMDAQLITANQCTWLNLPTRVQDREEANCGNGCLGPIVHPGPLWMADLTEDCNWSLEATVRFRLARWCAGKKAELYLVACGNKYLLDSYTIPSTGLQVVTLTGNFVLPGGCSDVHLLVCDNDDKIVTAHVVEFASFKGCCL